MGQRCCNICSKTVDWDKGLCDNCMNQNKESLINYERTWRMMICLNPQHEIVKFRTNKIGDILCPTCNARMVVHITPSRIIEELIQEELE